MMMLKLKIFLQFKDPKGDGDVMTERKCHQESFEAI